MFTLVITKIILIANIYWALNNNTIKKPSEVEVISLLRMEVQGLCDDWVTHQR